jgi:hypothetical protein
VDVAVRDHAYEPTAFDHRQVADIPGVHDFAHLLQRRVRRDRNDGGRHDVSHEHTAPPPVIPPIPIVCPGFLGAILALIFANAAAATTAPII